MQNFILIILVVFAFFTLSCNTSVHQRQVILSNKAPKPIGPYSQAILDNGFLFVSGQIGIDPNSNKMVVGGIEAEFIQVMENIGNILHSAGLNYSDVVKTTIYLVNLDDFETINKIYAKYFEKNYPARETIEVSQLPKNAKVEVSVIADARRKKK
ncbi:MAG: RidA family protein [Candidatus Kapaibacteriales bacterium]